MHRDMRPRGVLPPPQLPHWMRPCAMANFHIGYVPMLPRGGGPIRVPQCLAGLATWLPGAMANCPHRWEDSPPVGRL
eukprot:scaffold230_cov120-Skeletonema_dohrnii-CCMP3373.AAC.1